MGNWVRLFKLVVKLVVMAITNLGVYCLFYVSYVTLCDEMPLGQQHFSVVDPCSPAT
jgi:hypothetical protein